MEQTSRSRVLAPGKVSLVEGRHTGRKAGTRAVRIATQCSRPGTVNDCELAAMEIASAVRGRCATYCGGETEFCRTIMCTQQRYLYARAEKLDICPGRMFLHVCKVS